MTARTAQIILVFLLLLGFGLRGCYLAEIAGRSDFTHLSLDPAYYDYWAGAIVSGDWSPPAHSNDPEIPFHPYLKPPGYPFFLALVYTLAGTRPLSPRLVQMLIGALMPLFAYLIARQRWGKRMALLWASAMASCGLFIYYEGELLEPPLMITLFLGLFYFLLRWRESRAPGFAIAAGIALGTAAIIRPNSLAVTAVIILWQFIALRRRRAVRIFPRHAALFLAFVMLPIIPVTIRNYSVSGEFVPLTVNAGINFYLGNNPVKSGHLDRTGPLIRSWDCFDYPLIVRHLSRWTGRPLSHSQASAFLGSKAWSWIRENPGLFLERTAEKALLTVGPKEVSVNKEEEIELRRSAALRYLPRRFSPFFAAALWGAILILAGRPRSRTAEGGERGPILLATAMAAVYLASFVPFIPGGVYRVPALPFLMLAGAAGVDIFLDLIGRRRFTAAAAAAGAGAAVLLASFSNPTGYRPSESRWHFDRGLALSRDGKDDEAARQYRQALELDDNFADARINLGNVYYRQERFSEAADHYRRAIRLRPDLLNTYISLGRTLEKMGELDEAAEAYNSALGIDNRYPPALNRLGVLLMREYRTAEAVMLFQAALTVSPAYTEARENLTEALKRLGLPDDELTAPFHSP